MGLINKKGIIYSLYIILASRAGIGGIAPFGPAAFAICIMSYDMSSGMINVILYALSCVIGSLTTGIWQQTVIMSVAVVLFYLSYLLLQNTQQQGYPLIMKSAISLTLCVAAPIIIMLAASNSTIMDAINLATQVAITFIMFFVYKIAETSLSDIIDKNYTNNKQTPEELACLAITAIVGLIGFPSIIIFGLSLRNIISIVVIMIFSLRGGIGTGAAAGVMIGIITNSSSALIICLYSFCGFLAGLLNKFKKAGVVIAFVVGNVVLAFLIGASKEIIISMYETGFAAVIFGILPAKVYDFFKIPVIEENLAIKNKIKNNDEMPARLDYAGKIRNSAMKKAKLYSKTMCEMSQEFMEIVTSNEEATDDDCIIRVYNKVCNTCKMSSECWKKEYKIREKAIKKCEKIIEKTGYKSSEIITVLGKFCIKPLEVGEELKIGIEIRRIEKLCNAKITECKSMLVNQFAEIGQISAKIADEIKLATSYDINLENTLLDALKRNDIYVYDVIAINNELSLPNVSIYLRDSQKKYSIGLIENILSKEIGTKMKLTKIIKNKNSLKELKFAVMPCVNLKVGYFALPANENEISGDAHCIIETDKAETYIILSDGMGTGEEAYRQSVSVIKIIEMFIKSGVSISSALSTVNMLLTTRSKDVDTASVDICCINKHLKKIMFIKMGAMPSVLIKNDSIRVVEINRPPVGVSADLEGVSNKISEYEAEDTIALVMFTDGIFDAFSNSGINKKVFYEYIANVIRKNQEVEKGSEIASKEIINKACELSDCRDDMSVIVIYFS